MTRSYLLQYSHLEKSLDRGAWWAIVHGVANSWTSLSDEHFHFLFWKKRDQKALLASAQNNP